MGHNKDKTLLIHPKYGGTLEYFKDMEVGTKFYVCNGDWNGEIVEIEGVNKVFVEETGKYLEVGDNYAWIRGGSK